MTSRKKLGARVQKLEGDDNPFYFNSTKCNKTSQERIDEKKLEISTSPKYSKHRKEIREEIANRKAERDASRVKFLTERESELVELNSQEANK